MSRNSHSHTTNTCQPIALNCSSFIASRARFPSNFARQKSRFDFGMRVSAHAPPCMCQKQPCTNTIFRRLGKTRSGFPGRRLSCSRYLNPRAWSALRMLSSGFVSRSRMRAMRSERCSGESVSITVILSSVSPSPSDVSAQLAIQQEKSGHCALAACGGVARNVSAWQRSQGMEGLAVAPLARGSAMEQSHASRVLSLRSLRHGMLVAVGDEIEIRLGLMEILGISEMVPGAGIEPARLAAGDFESPASTNFTTRAGWSRGRPGDGRG